MDYWGTDELLQAVQTTALEQADSKFGLQHCRVSVGIPTCFHHCYREL